MINRENNFDDGTNRECTKCSAIFKKTSKTVTICNTCNSERVKSQSTEKKMWQRAKTRARNKGMEFNITPSDIVLPKVCPILGVELKENKGRSGAFPDSYSLDRVDNSKGYIKGNIMVISQLANSMKASASKEQLIAFAKYILDPTDPNEFS